MRNRFLVPLSMCLLVSMASAADDAVKAEMEKMEGTWQLSSAISDGVETDAEIVKKIRVVIKDSKHTVHFGDEVVAKEIPFIIDPKASPKTADDMLPDGKVIRSIYKLDGDILTSCVSKPDKDRPTEFASKAGSGLTLRVFKRVKN